MSLRHTRLLRPTAKRHRLLKRHARMVHRFNSILRMVRSMRGVSGGFQGIDGLFPMYPLHLGSGIMVGPCAHKALLDYFDNNEAERLLVKECGVPPNMILVEDPVFGALDGEEGGLLIRDWRSILTPTPPVIIDPYSGRRWGGP